jgi:methionyl-tRNA formyltransferase
MNQPDLRIAFAGDRDISVWVLEFLLNQGVQPEVLLVSSSERASHADKLKSMCSFLPKEYILVGKAFRSEQGMALLESLNIDFVIGIHFPYIVPESVLNIPKIGVLNLHPAYLPYNRGWHTPSWAILEGTPVGATLHFMDAGVDTGDIVHQREVVVSPGDTAHTLYQKVKICELETFKEAWPQIATGTYKHHSQENMIGTEHKRSELFVREIQEINLNEVMRVGTLLNRLRALTTNQISEAAYFEEHGRRYRIQVSIAEEVSE